MNPIDTLVTRTVAGHRLTLVMGVVYIASRPFADRGRRDYPVTIEPLHGADVSWVTVNKLSWEAANNLVNAFNNGHGSIGNTSFHGRVWE